MSHSDIHAMRPPMPSMSYPTPAASLAPVVNLPTAAPAPGSAMHHLAEVAADVARWQQLVAVIEPLTAEIEDIKHRLRQAHDTGQPTPGVSITATRRFHPAAAREVLAGVPAGAELLAAISEMQISTELAKQVLPPALYKACTREAGKATVRLAGGAR